MIKSLANKLRLKKRLSTIHMDEGTSIQTHLTKFNSIIIDLENLKVKIEDEDKVVLLIVFVPSSYKHFKEIMFYMVLMILCLLRMLNQIYPQRNNLIFKYILMIKEKYYM